MPLEVVEITRAGHAVIDLDYPIKNQRNTERVLLFPPERLTMDPKIAPSGYRENRDTLDLLRGQKFAETNSICPASVWHYVEK